MPLPSTLTFFTMRFFRIIDMKKGLVLISSAVGAEDRGGVRSDDGRGRGQAVVKVSTAQLPCSIYLLFARFGFCAVLNSPKIVLCCLTGMR